MRVPTSNGSRVARVVLWNVLLDLAHQISTNVSCLSVDSSSHSSKQGNGGTTKTVTGDSLIQTMPVITKDLYPRGNSCSCSPTKMPSAQLQSSNEALALGRCCVACQCNNADPGPARKQSFQVQHHHNHNSGASVARLQHDTTSRQSKHAGDVCTEIYAAHACIAMQPAAFAAEDGCDVNFTGILRRSSSAAAELNVG